SYLTDPLSQLTVLHLSVIVHFLSLRHRLHCYFKTLHK
ncbi:hypothetical protein N303_06067, partial [Cuculus canorus]